MLAFLYTLKPLFLPPLNLVLLALVGWLCMRRWRVFGRSLIFVAVAGLFLLSLPLVAGSLLKGLQVYPHLDTSQPVPENAAIVVLSAGMYAEAPEYGGEDAPGSLALERLRYAAKLHRDLGLPVLTTGGTLGDYETSLAEAMSRVLTEELSVSQVWTEREASNTYENASYSEKLLRERGITTVYLVTHSWHMRRAVLVFEEVGLNVIPAPTRMMSDSFEPSFGDFVPNAGALNVSYYALHEWLGQIWYLLVHT